MVPTIFGGIFLYSVWQKGTFVIREVATISKNFQIYHDISAQLLAEISMYPGISEEQLCLLHPEIGKSLKHTLVYLKKRGRMEKDSRGRLFPAGRQADSNTDGVYRAVWVLLDFLPDIEHYTASDYPATVVFFIRGEEYQIVYTPPGYEAVIVTILRSRVNSSVKQIMLIDQPEQIPLLHSPNICGYCTVDAEGHIQYYQSPKRGIPE